MPVGISAWSSGDTRVSCSPSAMYTGDKSPSKIWLNGGEPSTTKILFGSWQTRHPASSCTMPDSTRGLSASTTPKSPESFRNQSAASARSSKNLGGFAAISGSLFNSSSVHINFTPIVPNANGAVPKKPVDKAAPTPPPIECPRTT